MTSTFYIKQYRKRKTAQTNGRERESIPNLISLTLFLMLYHKLLTLRWIRVNCRDVIEGSVAFHWTSSTVSFLKRKILK